MELLTAAALKRIGETFSFDLEDEVGPVLYGGRELRFAEPLRVSGTYVFDGTAFLVEGTVKTAFHSVCGRCAESFVEPFSCGFSERFVRDAVRSEDDEESYSYVGDRLKLDDAVMDNLFLSIPLISVCREDCKGLCPVCGVNRNKETCTCDTAVARRPFAELEALRNENKEV